jgi:hypothetical protein
VRSSPLEHAHAGEPQVGRWPDFVGIGAIKAGTTWLHTCLAEHPQVYSPPTKEIQFWNDRFDLGHEWYRELFAKSPRDTRCGEFTPGYMHDPATVTRMKVLPETTKFLVSLRNPVDRAFSHFMMTARDSDVEDPSHKISMFAEIARDASHPAVRNGFYARQLAPYFEAFGKQRIHCVLFEDIPERPLEVLRNVFGFVDVDPHFVPSSARRVINPAARYRHARFFRWMRAGVQRAERGALRPLILWLKLNGVRDLVLDWSRRPQTLPGMDPDTRRRLSELYDTENRRLGSLTGLDLSRWTQRP